LEHFSGFEFFLLPNRIHARPKSTNANSSAASPEDLVTLSMSIQEQIKEYISNQPEPKRSDMQELHRIILEVLPACKLWFLDGKNSENKTVSNPNIGYGIHIIKYADGKTREFYQIGLSANKTGISVYILGIKDKKFLAQTYGKKLGKASVSGYCIKFKTLKDINIDMLEAAIRYGIGAQNEKSKIKK
jgi:hypothetical protein